MLFCTHLLRGWRQYGPSKCWSLHAKRHNITVGHLYVFSHYVFMLNYNANASLQQGLLFNSDRASSCNDVRVALFYVRNDGVRMYKCLCVWLVFHVAYDTHDDRPTIVFL
jgi:hypothetical protein